MIIRLFEMFIYGVTLDSGWTFLLAFLQSVRYDIEIEILKVSLWSNLTPKSFSQSPFFISKFSALLLTVLFVLNNERHLPALLFIKLSLNHLTNLVDASSKDLTNPSMLFVLRYGVLPSAQLAISKSSILKNKSIKKILNNKDRTLLYPKNNVVPTTIIWIYFSSLFPIW